MRVVSWNLAYWKPASYKSVENRRRQWALLASMAPDVVLLQECRPTDLTDHAPEWLARKYEIFGTIPSGWTACSAVLVHEECEPAALDLNALPATERRWLDYLSGYLAFATATIGNQRRILVSVHSIAKEVNDERITEEDHQGARRSNLLRAWHNDLAAAALRPLSRCGSFVIGGDWNTARTFDENYFDRWGAASTEFFGVLRQWGWRESLRATHPQEVPTYLDPNSAPYELDHVFTDVSLHDRLERASVLSLADHHITRELSDHAPVVVDFNLARADRMITA